MITEQEVEEALDYLRDSAEQIARAAANRVALEEGRKSRKALLMCGHREKPLAAQEREAYASESYREYIEGLKQAVYEHEKCKAMRTAKEALIEAWRSMNANIRAMKI